MQRVPGVLRVAHFVEGLNEGLFPVGFEGNAQVHGRIGRRCAVAKPALGDVVPGMLDLEIVPAGSVEGRKRCGDGAEEEDERQHRRGAA